jgi:hypothetical protein
MHRLNNWSATLLPEWQRAQELASQSLRLRSFIQVLQANRHRTLTPSHPLHLLADLVADVTAHQEGRALGARPSQYRDALAWLRKPRYLRSSRYRWQCWRFDRKGAPDAVCEFVDLFLRFAARQQIPLHAVSYCHGTGVLVVVHSVQMGDMPAIAHDLLGHMGGEVARKAGLPIEWGGAAAPSCWRFCNEPS